MNEYEATERATLEQLSRTWEAQGFQVYLQPSGKSVPEFLQRYKPDAILIRGEERVIVEAIRKGQPHAEEKVRRLQSLMLGQTGWRLEIVYSGEEVDAVKTVDKKSIRSALLSADGLARLEPRASLLMMWAALEAVARNLFPSQTNRPQSPGRVVELLAGSGEITPSEAQLLRGLMQLRNRVIHGELDATVRLDDLTEMHRIVSQLAQSENF